MSRSLIKLLCFFFVFLPPSTGCRFMDLRSINISCEPDKPYTVLDTETTALQIHFGTGMIKREAEKALVITASNTLVQGDFSWLNSTLVFTPVPNWIPGQLYHLTLKGSIRSEDGRELRPNLDIPFFAVSDKAAPVLLSSFPQDGSSVGTAEPLLMEFEFSRRMDPLSVEEALVLQGFPEPEYIWSQENRLLQLAFQQRLNPWTDYKWTLSRQACSVYGVPLCRVYSASFVSDADTELPEVLRSYTAVYSEPSWIDTGQGLDALDRNCAIAVQFNKPMDTQHIENLLRLYPAVSGRIEACSQDTLVFIPDQDLENECTYTLIVSSEAADSSGLQMKEDYIECFTPAFEALYILEVCAAAATPATGEEAYQVSVSEPDGLLTLDIRFSQVFSEEAAADAAFRISLDPHFPHTLSSPVLRSACQSSADTLTVQWCGLEKGNAASSHFYRLNIPGALGGINSGNGPGLKESFFMYLEVLP